MKVKSVLKNGMTIETDGVLSTVTMTMQQAIDLGILKDETAIVEEPRTLHEKLRDSICTEFNVGGFADSINKRIESISDIARQHFVEVAERVYNKEICRCGERIINAIKESK